MKKRLLTIILAAVMSFSPIAIAEGSVSADLDDQTATTTDKTTDAPVYIVRSGGTVMLTYENGKLTSEKMYTDQSGALTPADLKLIDGTNYVPFRYLFEKFGFLDVTDELDEEFSHDDSNSEGNEELKEAKKKDFFLNNFMSTANEKLEKEQNKNKIGAYFWYQDKFNTKITIKVIERKDANNEDDNKIKTLSQGNGDNNGSLNIRRVDGTSYLQLNSLKDFKFEVEYCSNLNTVFISDKPLTEGEKDNKQDTQLYTEAKNKYKEEYIDKRNDNYTTYSDLYLFNDNVRSLKKDLETYGYKNEKTESFTGINCVNQYGNILIFTDQHLNLYYTEITNDADYIVKKPSLISGDCFDKISFNGSYIFGIKVKDENSYSGTMVKIKVGFGSNPKQEEIIKVGFDGNPEQVEMLVMEETESNIKNAETLLYEETDNGEQYIYFLDNEDNYTLKRIQVNNAGKGVGNVKKLTCNGNALKCTQYYSISGKYLFHNRYDDNSTTIYTIDSSNGNGVQLQKPQPLNNDKSPVKSLIGANNSFYYVIDVNNKNKLTNVNINNSGNIEYADGYLKEETKIRKLAVFDNALYGKIDEDYTYNDEGYVEPLFSK